MTSFKPLLLDAALLSAALAIFLIAGWPVAGWGAVSAAWVVGRLLQLRAESIAADPDADGSDAIRAIGVSIIGRAWLIGLTILGVGLIVSREAGLAAALLAAAVYTVHFMATMLARPVPSKERPS